MAATEKLTTQVQGQPDPTTRGADAALTIKDTGLKMKKNKSVIGEVMKRLEKKVDELPEVENSSLEDSIKTMLLPWKNNDKLSLIIRNHLYPSS